MEQGARQSAARQGGSLAVTGKGGAMQGAQCHRLPLESAIVVRPC